MKGFNWLIFIIVSAGALAADQILKISIMRKLSTVGEFSVLGDIFRVHFYPNEGVAFGIPLKGPLLVIFLVAVFVILLVLFLRYLRNDKIISTIALALVLGGAVGNIVDRFRVGYVIDYISISILPVFNLADIFIIAGVLLLVWRIMVVDQGITLNPPDQVSRKTKS